MQNIDYKLLDKLYNNKIDNKSKYLFKNALMQYDDLIKATKKLKRYAFSSDCSFDFGSGEYFEYSSSDYIKELYNMYFYGRPWLYEECKKLLNSGYQKKSRIENKIISMLSKGQCYFLTLTFDNTTLVSTTSEWRKKYVKQWLKNNYEQGIANIDFGNEREYVDRKKLKRVSTKREHYHAVVLTRENFKVDYMSWCKYSIIGENDVVMFKYCYMNAEYIPCKTGEISDISGIAPYLNKLSSHALKKSAKRENLIYFGFRKK